MSSTLALLLEHAERQRDAARAAVQQAEGGCNRALVQLEQLRAYQGDYRARAPGTAGLAAPIELLRCHQGFMGRLDQALLHQHQAVKDAEAELLRRRELLRQAEQKLASTRKLVDRREAERKRFAQRAEQRASDESALQRHRRGGVFGDTR